MSRNENSPFSHLVRCKVRIKTGDGEYEGIVKTVVGEMSRISLFNVRVVPENTIIVGLQTFYAREIISCKLVETQDEIQRNKKETNTRKVVLPPLPFAELASTDENMRAVLDMPEYQKLKLKQGKIWLNMGNPIIAEDLDLDLDKPKINFDLPDNYLIIDSCNAEFNSALEHIKSQNIIGVHIEGAKMGRRGEVCLLNIATVSCIYLFDIFELGAAAFSLGLKDILESSSITKVFHDCRLASDILFHKFKINLKNVSDTQVIDIIQRRYFDKKRRIPNSVRIMSTLLHEFLDLDEHSIYFDQEIANGMLNSVVSWQIRPLTIYHRVSAISHVIYLCALQKSMMDNYLRDLIKGTDIYLGFVRDYSNEEFALEMANSWAILPAFGKIFGEEIRFSHSLSRPIEPTNSINCIFDKVELLESVMSTKDASDFCINEWALSEFNITPDKIDTSKTLQGSDAKNNVMVGSNERSIEAKGNLFQVPKLSCNSNQESRPADRILHFDQSKPQKKSCSPIKEMKISDLKETSVQIDESKTLPERKMDESKSLPERKIDESKTLPGSNFGMVKPSEGSSVKKSAWDLVDKSQFAKRTYNPKTIFLPAGMIHEHCNLPAKKIFQSTAKKEGISDFKESQDKIGESKTLQGNSAKNFGMGEPTEASSVKSIESDNDQIKKSKPTCSFNESFIAADHFDQPKPKKPLCNSMKEVKISDFKETPDKIHESGANNNGIGEPTERSSVSSIDEDQLRGEKPRCSSRESFIAADKSHNFDYLLQSKPKSCPNSKYRSAGMIRHFDKPKLKINTENCPRK